MSVKAIPDGFTTVTPYLIVDEAAKAIDFYKKTFNAIELFRMEGPDNKIGHAEIQIGNSRLMLADGCPEMGLQSPKALDGAGISIMLYVDQVNDLFPQALAAGGKELHPVQDQFYGDRSGTLEDPFGHVWTISTHIADLSEQEIRLATEAFMKAMPNQKE